MSDQFRREFNPYKFSAQQQKLGRNCRVIETSGIYKTKDPKSFLFGRTWTSKTVYIQKDDGRIIEYVPSTTGSWFFVSEEKQELLLTEFNG